MKTITLTQGKIALVDDEDFEKVRGFKWCAHKIRNTFYAERRRRKSDGPGPGLIYLHRVITNCPDGLEPDHKDGDGLNNRRENLRVGTHQKNHTGFVRKQTGTTSRFRGVSWVKGRGKWRAEVMVGGRPGYLGLFSSEEDAARAYDKKAIELGFAREALNFQ